MSWRPKYFTQGPGWEGRPGPSPEELENPESLYWNTRANWMMDELVRGNGCGRTLAWLRELYPNGIPNWRELAEDAERMLNRLDEAGLITTSYPSNNGWKELSHERIEFSR